jgi:DNA polymerase V
MRLLTTWQVGSIPSWLSSTRAWKARGARANRFQPADSTQSRTPVLLPLPMPPLQLADLPVGIPIPYRSAEAPDGLDLNSLLIAHPLSTFYMRVRGHRLRNWGVHDGDLLLIDRSIDPRPGHLVVVAHGERFLLRPLEVEGENWRLASLSPGEVPLPLDPGDLETSGLFGVGVAVVHDMVRGKRAQVRRIR